MDIGKGNGYPAAALSNLTPHRFVFRGVECASMEGLLQAFKFSSPDMQKAVCQLTGLAAKFKGKKKKWFRTQKLHWMGQEIDRHSDEYQLMLDEAYDCLFDQSESARNALLASHNAVLEHSIGKSDPSRTVLTRQEFCSRLTRKRARLQARTTTRK